MNLILFLSPPLPLNLVEWACRDRYLWIHVLSKQTAWFEAIGQYSRWAVGSGAKVDLVNLFSTAA